MVKNGFATYCTGKNPPKFLLLKPNPLGGGIIAQLSQKGKGAAAWASRPQRGDIRHHSLPGSLGSGLPVSTMHQPLAAGPPRPRPSLKDFRPWNPKPLVGLLPPPGHYVCHGIFSLFRRGSISSRPPLVWGRQAMNRFDEKFSPVAGHLCQSNGKLAG